jgi:putative thioredoxin
MGEYVMDVSDATFDADVVAFSSEKPVVVDFWAPWCQPCRTLAPMLERLADEFGGAFRLARVNVDENPGLSAKFGIQGIPAVMAFREGRLVDQFTGAHPETVVRKMLAGLAPSPAMLAVREATGLLTSRHWPEAEQAARKAVGLDPRSGAAALCLARALLAQGKGQEALGVLDGFPPSDEVAQAVKLQPLADFLAEAQSSLDQPMNDREAEYLRAAHLIAHGNLQAALDGLLDVLRADKHYRNDQARKVFLAILDLMGEEDPLTREYRNELASVLF